MPKTYRCDTWICPVCRGEDGVNIRDPYSKHRHERCPSCLGARYVPSPLCNDCDQKFSECACAPTCNHEDECGNCGVAAECVARATFADVTGGRCWYWCDEHAGPRKKLLMPIDGHTVGALRRLSHDNAVREGLEPPQAEDMN